MRPSRITALIAAFLLAAAVASATTFIPVSDSNLADQAVAVARVKVIAAEPGPANRALATDVLVEVEELVQGYLPASTILVRVPGGERADGVVLEIQGAPDLQSGEEALLFLSPGADGTYEVLHLMLGAFHIRLSGGVRVAEQDLSGAHQLGTAKSSEPRVERDLDRFTAWLADRANGLTRNPDYWIARPNGAPSRLPKAFAPLNGPDNVPARWFTFDSGRTVSWNVGASAQPGLSLDQTVASFQAAIAAWTDDPTSSIAYVYAGLTNADGGIGVIDRVNGVLFNDPKGQVPGTFDCRTGGVVAIGGSYFYASTRMFRSQRYHESFEADVVTNDGTECFLRNNPTGAAEVFAHELGHTLGFGHATDPQALMFARAHNDGRGARLGDDDRTGASLFYGDGSYQPTAPPPPPPPAGEITLTASASRTSIELSWSNTVAGVAGFRVECKLKKGAFQVITTVPGSATGATIDGLKRNYLYTLRITALDASGAAAGSSNEVRIRTRK